MTEEVKPYKHIGFMCLGCGEQCTMICNRVEGDEDRLPSLYCEGPHEKNHDEAYGVQESDGQIWRKC